MKLNVKSLLNLGQGSHFPNSLSPEKKSKFAIGITFIFVASHNQMDTYFLSCLFFMLVTNLYRRLA